MAASRGPVYKTRHSALFIDGTGGQSWHDGCGCTAEPVYDRTADWPGHARQWQRLWADVTAGLSGEDARRAFRRAVDAQRGTRGTGARPETEPTQATAEVERRSAVPAEPEQPRPAEAEPANQPPEAEQRDPLAGVIPAALTDHELYDPCSASCPPPRTPRGTSSTHCSRIWNAARPPNRSPRRKRNRNRNR